MRMNKLFVLFSKLTLASVFIAGCIMPESNHVEPDYFLLSEVRAENNESFEKTNFSFYLREIELPRYLKDSRMVYRPSGHKIVFRESKRWGEPLEDGIARVVSMNLQYLDPSSQFSIFPNRRKENLTWDLSIAFSSFEKISDQVAIEAKWSAKHKSSGIVTGVYSSAFPLNRLDSELEEINTFNLGLHELAKSILGGLSSN